MQRCCALFACHNSFVLLLYSKTAQDPPGLFCYVYGKTTVLFS